MRINANKKIHQVKRDPYKLLLRITTIIAIVGAISVGVFLLCNAAVQSDYKAKQAAVIAENEAGQQEFDAKMNALRSENSTPVSDNTGDQSTAPAAYWETTLNDVPWRVEDATRTPLENVSTLTIARSDALLGGLLLVNPWHAIPADYSADTLVSVGNSSSWKIAVTDGNVRLFPVAFDALQNMVTDAGAQDLADYMVVEAYRTNETQTQYFENRMQKLSDQYSGDILIEQTKRYVNYPGTSEYQTGMSFQMKLYNKNDATVGNSKFQETAQGQWFTDNCWKYGVIFRFPTADFPNSSWEDKSYKTGVSSTLNLYRYVGAGHAAAMKVLDYCLEEYVEFLIDHPHLYIYEDGALKYEIYRIAADESSAYDIPVPNPASSYTASLDNMGGLVMTYSYNQ